MKQSFNFSIYVFSSEGKSNLILVLVAVVTLIGCSTFACVNCFTDDLQMAAQKMATSLTNSMSEEAHHARVKRQGK